MTRTLPQAHSGVGEGGLVVGAGIEVRTGDYGSTKKVLRLTRVRGGVEAGEGVFQQRGAQPQPGVRPAQLGLLQQEMRPRGGQEGAGSGAL